MRLVAGNYQGKRQMFIQTDENDGRLSNILGNLKYFKFHSDYKMFEMVGSSSGRIALPAHNKVVYSHSSKKGTSSYDIPTRNTYSKTVLNVAADDNTFCLAFDANSGQPINGATVIQKVGSSFRTVTTGFMGGVISIFSDATTLDANLPTITLDYTLYVFKVSGGTRPNPGVMFHATPTKVSFGEGLFDSDRAYLQEVSTGNHFMLFGKIPFVATRYIKFTPTGGGYFRRIQMAYNLGGFQQSLDGGAYPPNQTVYKVWSR